MRLSPCVLVQPDGWARGEREGYGEPCDVTSLSLSLNSSRKNLLSPPAGSSERRLGECSSKESCNNVSYRRPLDNED